MNPAFFGTGGRRLFGIYQAPVTGEMSDRGIVLCPPWGVEYLMSHRSLRQLAMMLASSGIHVLRFDYYGTGDSAGDASEASMAGCEADISTAFDELIEISQVTHVGLVGLRLGADLAARVCARQHRPVRELVLWDPVVLGRNYLADVKPRPPAGVLESTRSATLCAREHGSGFTMSDAFESEVAELDLVPLLGRLPAHTLLATSEQHPALAQLHRQLPVRASPVEAIHIEGPSPWREQGNLGMAGMPAELLQSILGWLVQ